MRRGPQRWPAVTPGFRACGLFRSRDQLPSSFHGNLGLVSAFLISAVSVSAVFGFPVDRPLEFGHLWACGR